SKTTQQYGWIALVCGVAFAFGLFWRIKRGTEFFAKTIESIAPLRRRWDEFRLAKLYQSLALLFRGGYTLDEALEVATELDLGVRLSGAIARTRLQIAQGRSASLSFASAGLTNDVTERLLAAGERSGEFDAVLQTISDRHATAFATFVERATRVAEPLLLLLVALGVGGIVVLMYMPIFDMASGIGSGR
ncbi:MAG: type II secretion system F family protein, partial [Burkholderiaceae bacterium]